MPDMPMFEDPQTRSTFLKQPDESLPHAIARSQMAFNLHPKRTSLKKKASLDKFKQYVLGRIQAINDVDQGLVTELMPAIEGASSAEEIKHVLLLGFGKEEVERIVWGFITTSSQEVTMPASEFFDEHKHLIPTLEHGSQKARLEEGKEQKEEVQGWREKLKTKGHLQKKSWEMLPQGEEYTTLKNYKIQGNFHFDSSFFKAADMFVKDASFPVEQRAEIVDRIDDAQGSPHSTMSPEEKVAQYIRDTSPEAFASQNTSNTPQKPRIAEAKTRVFGIDTQRTTKGTGAGKQSICSASNENPVKSWVIRKEGNLSLIGRECKTHAGIFIEASGKPLESVKLSKGEKGDLQWRELISEAEWVAKFEDMLVKKSWEVKPESPIEYDVTAQSYKRGTDRIVGPKRTERINVKTNELFNGSLGTPAARNIMEVQEIYESFWNDMNPQSREVVRVSKVVPVNDVTSSLETLQSENYRVGEANFNCSLCQYYAPQAAEQSMTGTTPEENRAGVCSKHNMRVVGKMMCDDFKRTVNAEQPVVANN